MKYKKGEKIESIGAVYEHLYNEGLVLWGTLIYKIDEHTLKAKFLDCSDSFDRQDLMPSFNVEQGVFEAIEEEPLKMPEFFKVYKHKTNSDVGVVTAISSNKVFICGCFWQLKDFLANFEEVAK